MTNNVPEVWSKIIIVQKIMYIVMPVIISKENNRF